MTRFLFLTAVFCAAFSAAVAEEIYRWTNESYVVIQPSSRPGVIAEVTFLNEDIHSSDDEITLTLDGLSIVVQINTDRSAMMRPDTMTVTPPAGFIAYPPEVTVPEGGAGTILILLEGVS